MPRQSRTRITIALPAPLSDDLPKILTLDMVLTELKQICGRVITSTYDPSVFNSQWVERRRLYDQRSKMVLIIADAPMSVNDPHLLEYLEERKVQWEQDFGRRIHITVHRVYRIVEP